MTGATKHSYDQKADLEIVLGSSLRVTPACDLPSKILGTGGRVVIIILQSTPHDRRVSLVMQMLLEKLSPPSRTAVVGESEKSSSTALLKRADLPSAHLLLSLSWQVSGADFEIKGRDEQAFEKTAGEV